MKTEYEVALADRRAVAFVARNMRAADIAEAQATYGEDVDVERAVQQMFEVSRDTTFVGQANGLPFCVFGIKVPSLLGGVARPWMLGTDEVRYHSREFLRQGKRIVRVWSQAFPHMRNYVDQRNTDAVRWLQWVGFQVYYPVPFGAMGLPFHMFEMRT